MDEFIEALEKALTSATDIEQLFSIWERNVDAVRAINKHTTRLTPHGNCSKSCCIYERSRNRPSETREANICTRQAKQLRPKDRQKRPCHSRNKTCSPQEHLRFVASQPCVICGRTPSHAHHVRYAQSRGLALKVSDEFTVPLCAIHHRENHTTGDERRWWQERKIDPLTVAAELWGKSLQSSVSD